MIDWKKVKSLTIPEGSVKSVSANGVKLWDKPSEEPTTYTLSGTWLFDYTPFAGGSFIGLNAVNYIPINFTSNGNNYTKMGFVQGDDLGIDFVTWLFYDETEAFNGRASTWGWTNNSYRTITFAGKQEVSKEFYDWFTANAKPQLITFTIEGNEYQAINGMTWGEWVDSSYNTLGSDVNYDNTISGEAGQRIANNGVEVFATDIIVANGTYTLEGGHGGGSN